MRRSLVLLALAFPAAAGTQTPARVTVRVENPAAIQRMDETIAIAWSELRRRLPDAQPARVRVVDAATAQEVVTQVLDGDGDGTPDSLLFQTSLWPNERKSFAVEPSASALTPKGRVFIRYDTPRDDVAWESDRIAFRIYGQGLWKTPDSLVSNGIDVWVKRTRELILDKWYAKGHDGYHADRGEGADFYAVGQTLGTGGTGIWRDNTLHRFRNFRSYRIVVNGPIRAVFELQYDPIDAGGLRVAETKRVIIDAGQNLYRTESVFRAEGATEIPIVVGLVKRRGMIGSASRAQGWAWLSGWGPVDVKQGEGGHGDLGTAVVMERARVQDWKEIDNHYLAVTAARPGQPVVHYVGAGWTASNDFRDVRDWWNHLTLFAQRLDAPVKVTIGQ